MVLEERFSARLKMPSPKLKREADRGRSAGDFLSLSINLTLGEAVGWTRRTERSVTTAPVGFRFKELARHTGVNASAIVTEWCRPTVWRFSFPRGHRAAMGCWSFAGRPGGPSFVRAHGVPHQCPAPAQDGDSIQYGHYPMWVQVG